MKDIINFVIEVLRFGLFAFGIAFCATLGYLMAAVLWCKIF